MNDVSSEPSMEDILSSIKRIIAEDTDPVTTPTRGRRNLAASEPLADRDVLELTESIEQEPLRRAEAEPAATPEKAPLVSDAALTASRSSLAVLSALVVKPEIVGSDTLEGMVREMLRPMLSDWLDQRLPDVVERLVAQEIQRITARG